jgi:predicted DNA-binding transcriptional regulator YafY
VSTDERREEIIRILLGGERTSIPILAQNLEASVSTIKRDLLVLTVDRGYPIMTEQGHGDDVYMMEFRHAHKHILSREQITALNTAISVVDTETAKCLQNILNAYA